MFVSFHSVFRPAKNPWSDRVIFRWNQARQPHFLTAEEAHRGLKTKAHQQYKDMAEVRRLCILQIFVLLLISGCCINTVSFHAGLQIHGQQRQRGVDQEGHAAGFAAVCLADEERRVQQIVGKVTLKAISVGRTSTARFEARGR